MIEVVDLTDAPASEWDALAVRSSRGEALQSHAWSEVKAAAGWRPWRVRIDRDGSPVAVCSLQERDIASPIVGRLPHAVGRRLGVAGELGRFLYAPFGPVLLGADAASALAGLRQIARRRHAALLVIDPAWEEGSEQGSALPGAGFVRAERAIQVATTGMYVPLHADEDAQWRLLNSNIRRNIERCRKAGVDVVRFDQGSASATLQAALATAYRMLWRRGAAWVQDDLARRVPRVVAAGAHRPGQASLWMARHEAATRVPLVHHSGDRSVLFERRGRPLGGGGRERIGRFAANVLLQGRSCAGRPSRFRDVRHERVDNHSALAPQGRVHPLWNLFRFKAQWRARPIQFVAPGSTRRGLGSASVPTCQIVRRATGA